MRKCQFCGENVNNNAKFCSYCGNKISNDDTILSDSNNCFPYEAESEVEEAQFKQASYEKPISKTQITLKNWIPAFIFAVLAVCSSGISSILFLVLAIFLSPILFVDELKQRFLPKKLTRVIVVCILVLVSLLSVLLGFSKRTQDNYGTDDSSVIASSQPVEKEAATPNIAEAATSENDISSPIPTNTSVQAKPSVSPSIPPSAAVSATQVPVAVEVFPKETALKAVVVSMTNCYSYDVFTDDGNSYDISKFHSYGDNSPSSLSVYKDGSWKKIDENTWHVEDLVLKMDQNPSEFYLRLSADITFENGTYILCNVKENHQKLEYLYDTDPSKYCYSEYTNAENNPFLIVAESLIN